MVRLIFSTIVVLHGLLHLIGFAREWNLGSPRRIAGKKLFAQSLDTSKTAGALWLAASALFLSAAIFYLLRKDWYWIPAAGGLVLSQTLIIIYWQDARYGTMVNAVILIAVISAAATMRFNTMVRREVKALQSQAATGEKQVTEEMVSRLPRSVQRWMRRSDVIGKKNNNIVRVEQEGRMRSTPDGKWMPFEAFQYFSIDPPAFVWQARIKAAPMIYIAGRDRFTNGEGHMLIKPLAVFTAANSSGKEINQGALLRYMAEMAWFPQAAVSDYLLWEEINENQVRVTMEYRGTSASGIYSFNDEGDVAGFEANRYGDFSGVYRKETWSIEVKGYKTLNGHRIGDTSEVTWKLKEGDFKWLILQLTKIE